MGRNGRFRSRTSPLERDGHGPRPDHDLLCDHARHGWRFWQLVRTHHDRGRSEEHTSELQSLMRISYAVFCLKKNTTSRPSNQTINSNCAPEITTHQVTVQNFHIYTVVSTR